MKVQRLPNGNLLVPGRVTNAEGTITGDTAVEIGPDNASYQHWLDWLKLHRKAVRGSRKPGRASLPVWVLCGGVGSTHFAAASLLVADRVQANGAAMRVNGSGDQSISDYLANVIDTCGGSKA